jgi:hypothetical protein
VTTGNESGLNRREFLRRSALASSLSLASKIAGAPQSGVTIVVDPEDPVASAPAAQWAAGELATALSERGIVVRRLPRIETSSAAGGDLCIVASGSVQPQAQKILLAANVSGPIGAEALALAPGKFAHRPVLLACGPDARGLVYALLELADRVRCSDSPHPAEALNLAQAIVEQPANAIRVINRSFESDREDKPWYNDREFWPPYLTMLAAQRFNRFNLTFGLGYDFTRHITDCYFHFAYPFLLPVPGYDVRAVPLADSERDRNLEMLRFISEQTVARGMDFQLGLWTHAFQWVDSPQANYTISGLTAETHAAYCRDALRALLVACPAISSLAFRVHGESGVPEESYDFWKTVFDGAVTTGRRIELNLHAKGIDQRLIEVALATGMPVTVSPKFWAEHMGLPYHQASIRETEKPAAEKQGDFFALSSGSRSFLRYSYGDLLTADRRYGVYTRIWPGTQRVLLWGDPVAAAACGRAAGFCGEQGLDLFEPLSFKGRRGSGVPGGRCSYQDAALRPQHDWQKFLYTYRVWGRHLYNPDTDPDVCRRLLRKQFGPAALAVEAALAQASRILPLVTTAHAPSAANNAYWPEMYTNMAIVGSGENTLYGDSLSPKVFGNASSFDPQLFSSVNDCAKEMLGGERSGRFSPVDVAQWLENMADSSTQQLAEARTKALDPKIPEFRRMEIDIAIQAGLGRFFAGKFRAGVLYAIFAQCGDRTVLEQALASYRRARTAWANLAERARGVYAADVSYGPEKNLRGHWLDRLPAIDQDIAAMEKQLGTTAPAGDASATPDHRRIEQAVHDALGHSTRPANRWHHAPASVFRPGAALPLELQVEKSEASAAPLSVRLLYRHVNQAENYDVGEMKQHHGRYYGEIPAAYTQSAYALQYFFEVHQGPKQAWLLPGFAPDLATQPYFLVRHA